MEHACGDGRVCRRKNGFVERGIDCETEEKEVLTLLYKDVEKEIEKKEKKLTERQKISFRVLG